MLFLLQFSTHQTIMRLLIVDEIHESLFQMLEQIKVAYTYMPRANRAEILNQIADYEGLLIRSKTAIDAEFLAKATHLKIILRAGAGLDLIDIALAKKQGIKVFAANEGNRDAVAEHTVGMLLALFANIVKADREVRQHIWNREGNRGVELMGKTIGLIGYGFNGKATSVRLLGFGCRVLAYDKYLSNYGNQYAREASMEQIMAEADIVSLHVPLTDETYHLINNSFIEQMKRPFYLVNIARGEITDLEAVVAGLQSKKILGACLDVLENEKINQLTSLQQIAFDYLCSSDRVILTPHIAGWTQESYIKINEVLVRNLTDYVNSHRS